MIVDRRRQESSQRPRTTAELEEGNTDRRVPVAPDLRFASSVVGSACRIVAWASAGRQPGGRAWCAVKFADPDGARTANWRESVPVRQAD